ncbi:hypothetical protein CEXT_2261 [Caerostris extrusa]|uniref:Uncharacterized protein n=1 Tax=Caerostris extrusa TaxID=172846 RepID=A0AAV4MKW6_CAEEX|nr:hypothetical protein CEXT_2261 [Caerostris extrusa]
MAEFGVCVQIARGFRHQPLPGCMLVGIENLLVIFTTGAGIEVAVVPSWKRLLPGVMKPLCVNSHWGPPLLLRGPLLLGLALAATEAAALSGVLQMLHV